VSRFIDEHRDRFGVEPICRTLSVSASAYYHRARGERSPRELEDERLLAVIGETHRANYEAYGYRRTWKALRRAGETTPRCRVQRLMGQHGIQGAQRRGKPWRTTIPDPHAHRRPDLVGRDFTATEPNRLWVGDLSYLRCWEGIVYFAFVLDVYSRAPLVGIRTLVGRPLPYPSQAGRPGVASGHQRGGELRRGLSVGFSARAAFRAR
jgi:putative transposase